MKKKNVIKINNKDYTFTEGQTVLEVAHKAGIDIPTFCNHPDFCAKGNCRVCVVDIKGQNKLQTSCSTLARDGMEISTNNAKVKKSRDLTIELLFAEHVEKCPTCVWRFECKLLEAARKYKLKTTRFEDRKGSRKIYKFANAIEIDGTQCIDCRNCIDACSVFQEINYLELKGKGIHQEIVPSSKKGVYCILCGQCALHCPVSAAQEQTSWEEVEKVIKDKNKIVVAQFAPSIRVSIGEDFGLPYGKVVTEQLVAGLKALGFANVFDVNFGADVTTIVEATELLDRVKNGGKMPMMTSCCPGWVNYVELYHPEVIPNLTTSRSPHIHLGGIIKTFWAEKMGVKAEDIVVVSIMPCTAKKYEVTRREMMIGENYPVDYVLTTREFSFMMKKNKINLAKLKKIKADNPLGEFTGAAALYGGSGGVMESALRTAQHMACVGSKNKTCDVRIDFKDVRGFDGLKEAKVNIAGTKMRIAVVNGIRNVKHIINRIDDYDYIEVMACPGGCIGGGGQPIPTTWEIRKKRVEALYALDKSKKVRKAHQNKEVKEVLDWLEKQGHEVEHSVLHTTYRKRKGY